MPLFNDKNVQPDVTVVTGSVNVTGSVGVTNSPTQISVDNFPATQNISGSVFVSTTGSMGLQVSLVSGSSIVVSNLQQFSVNTPISITNYDLAAASYTSTYAFTADALLEQLDLRFSTTQSRTITISLSTGETLFSETNSNLRLQIDFQSLAIDLGTSITLTVSQTGGACILNGDLTIMAGTLALGGNPVLGAGSNLIGSVTLDASPSHATQDVFGRLRVSDIYTLYSAVHQYDASPNSWDSIFTGSGAIAHVPNNSAVQLSVGTTSGDSIKFQTHNYFMYQPGKAQLLIGTGLLGAKTTNLVRRFGYYDDNNGLFFEITGTDVAIVRRTNTSGSPVDNRVTQSAWNIDTLDGSGGVLNPSGVALDTTKVQLMIVDFQWLSIGIVRWGFEIAGVITYIHIMQHANILTVPYMGTANLPVRYELTNTGVTSGTNTMLAICSVVASEGGQQTFGDTYAANTGTPVITVNAQKIPLISLRPSLVYKGVQNRGLIELLNIAVAATQEIILELWFRPTLTGAAWTLNDVSSSIAEIDLAASAITGGTRIWSSIVGGAGTSALNVSTGLGALAVARKLSINASGTTGDIVTLTASKITTNAAATAAINWSEFK